MAEKIALLAVYHKKPELIDFAQWLTEHGYRLIASGGTTGYLVKAGIQIQDVAKFVGGEAILGHKVVTLSREISAGLLCDRDDPDEMAQMRQLGIPAIGLVFVDLYPLKDVVDDPETTRESVIKMTDIGGPTLLRAAAKGRRIVVSSYDQLVEMMPHWREFGLPKNEDLDALDDLAKRKW
jgi:phosphoribosylaminoimidazolecarboxamide formyltransferase/IMP cyclohydrolase